MIDDRLLDFPPEIVPDGRRNAPAMRYWRATLRRLRDTANEAASASTAAGAAGEVATGAAASAQANADALNTLRSDFDDHTPLQAAPGVLGHVLQADAPAGASSVTAGPAPAVYAAAHSDAVSDRADDAHTRIDDLVAKLQAAGITL